MLKKLLFWLLSCCSLSLAFGAVELSFESLTMPFGTETHQHSEISLAVNIRNNGGDTATIGSNPIPAWWIRCTVAGTEVYKSAEIKTLIINPVSAITFPITLSTTAASQLGNQEITCTLNPYSNWLITKPSAQLTIAVIPRSTGRFDDTLDKVRKPLVNKIDGSIAEVGIGGVKSFVYNLIDKFAVPIAVFLGVLFGMIALYKIMFSDDEGALWQVTDLLTWWVVGIMIILSAKFIANTLYTEILSTGEIAEFSTILMVSKLYDSILRPLLKIGFYIMMGILFIILLIRVFSFVTADSEEIQEKSQQIILSTTIGLFIMIGAKQLVEGVYGKEELIRNSAAITITQVGGAFLNAADIPLIYTIIQWIMGLSGFILLAIIIVQTYKLLVNPSDESSMDSIKKTLLYALIGMIVIGAGYLIVNVVMIN